MWVNDRLACFKKEKKKKSGLQYSKSRGKKKFPLKNHY